MSPLYWERHPKGPFVTLIAAAATYLHPENYELDSLKALARRDGDEEMRVFKSELREALRDPSQLPDDELSESVEYDNGSDEAFLYWLWRQLYGDEPTGTEAAIGARINALPDRFTGRLDPQAVGDVCHAARAGEWAEALEVLSAGLINRKAQLSAAELDELAALFAAASMPVRPFGRHQGRWPYTGRATSGGRALPRTEQAFLPGPDARRGGPRGPAPSSGSRASGR